MARALRSFDYREWISIEMRSGWRLDNTTAVESALDFVNLIYGAAPERENAIAYGN
jgi:hypothetical protein